MNRSKLKNYAPKARREFIQAVTDRAGFYGLTEHRIEPITEHGDVAVIAGKPFPRSVAAKRRALEQRIARQGFEQVMEAMAYTWFNRLVAIRYMELHGYLDHGYRVLSHPEGKPVPEIVEHAEHVDLPGLDKEQVIDLKLDGTKEAELYRMLLIAQCNALHKAMPFLFERIDDETELLLPDNLLHSDSLIRKLVTEIDEADWHEVEIIGWLYQFYISEKKGQVIGKVVKSEDIPAATQLFTPNWIVKYLVQNSLGRKWMMTYPDSPLKEKMEYYIEPAEQTPEVQAQLKQITPDSLNPEELTLLDPACGSGHILVEAYDLLKAIYQERGYRMRDIPKLILEKNLFGLEIDDRAAQLAAFALMMKARADDRQILSRNVQPNVLAFQESKGLDAKVLTEALNAPLAVQKQPPVGKFAFMDEIETPLLSKTNPALKGDIGESDIAALLELFREAKTFGSLIRVPRSLTGSLSSVITRARNAISHGDLMAQSASKELLPLLQQAQELSGRYDAVVANPPYMGVKGMNVDLKGFLKTEYPDAKADLFAAFIERGFGLAKFCGCNAMVTMQSWMFLASFETMRTQVLAEKTIDCMLHMSNGVMGIAFGTAATVCWNQYLQDYQASFSYVSHKDLNEAGEPFEFPIRNDRLSTASAGDLKRIPGTPVAYWLSHEEREMYQKGKLVSQFSGPRKGMDTGENEKFLRLWYEVSLRRSNLINGPNGGVWFPYNKGGDYRRWYGNRQWVVNWAGDGSEIKKRLGWKSKKPTLRNQQHYFQEGYTWTTVSSGGFSARYTPPGALFDNGGCTLFAEKHLHFLGALLNSKIAARYLEFLSPTLNFQPGDVGRILYKEPECMGTVEDNAKLLVTIAKRDWDSLETSWDFEVCPLLRGENLAGTIDTAFRNWANECHARIVEVKRIEEENNLFLIEAYRLQCQLSQEISEDEIALVRPDREQDIKRLISYAIGCTMGRYSLDSPGLVYAHSGNEGFDSSQYKTFPADQDGIVPLTDTEWFDDDAANRLERFIATAWPEEHLEENLKFVADSLGAKKSEQSRDTIRRYLAQGFFKDHLKTYKKRPIYWLFSSGKLRAFQCLVYLHRYNEGTLARMRTEYVIPLQGRLSARIDQLAEDIEAAGSASHRTRLEKEREALVKQQAELVAFDEKLRHYADQRISLDLDDGVKVNYGKFGDLLAEVMAVTGKDTE